MTPPEERELLIEAVAGAFRPSDPRGGLGTHPGWHDLDDAGREEAYQVALELRLVEATLDPEGLSATGRAVMARIRGAR